MNEGGAGSIVRHDGIFVAEQAVELPAGASAAFRCWQARPGEIMTAVDREQNCWRVRLEVLNGESCRVVPFASLGPMESPLSISVYQAIPDKERFELVLQKLTELGATRIVPMESARSQTVAERDSGQRKSHRWPDVVLRAAKQCRRPMLPALGATTDFRGAMQDAAAADLKLMLYEGAPTWPLGEILGKERPVHVAVLVGPEGGFAGEERDAAMAGGFVPVSLGRRILRTETAAIAATSIIQYAAGDID